MARILVVEDDSNMRFLIAKILQRAGYETEEAENGRRALDVLKGASRIDLVISDILMPEMNGLQFLDYAKSKYPDLPIIMLSVHARPDWVEEAIEKGATCYLFKPFTHEQLTTIVTDVLSVNFRVTRVPERNYLMSAYM